MSKQENPIPVFSAVKPTAEEYTWGLKYIDQFPTDNLEELSEKFLQGIEERRAALLRADKEVSRFYEIRPHLKDPQKPKKEPIEKPIWHVFTRLLGK